MLLQRSQTDEGAARKNPCLAQSLGWMVFGQTNSQGLKGNRI